MSLPREIYVAGMPLLLRGWNGKYIQENSKNAEWVLDSVIYHGIPIRKTKIIFQSGRWKLKTIDNDQVVFNGPFDHSPDSDYLLTYGPIGKWKDGIHVFLTSNLGYWFCCNKYAVSFFCIFVFFVFIYWVFFN